MKNEISLNKENNKVTLIIQATNEETAIIFYKYFESIVVLIGQLSLEEEWKKNNQE